MIEEWQVRIVKVKGHDKNGNPIKDDGFGYAHIFDTTFYKPTKQDLQTLLKKFYEELIQRGFVEETDTPVCPICGGDTDETEHGRQYCYDCKEKLEEKK